MATQIYLCGIDTECCVLKTAFDLFENEYDVYVLKDYCACMNGETRHNNALDILKRKYEKVKEEDGYLKVYDIDNCEEIVDYLFKNNHVVSEIRKNKIGLEEYYIELMSNKEER